MGNARAADYGSMGNSLADIALVTVNSYLKLGNAATSRLSILLSIVIRHWWRPCWVRQFLANWRRARGSPFPRRCTSAGGVQRAAVSVDVHRHPGHPGQDFRRRALAVGDIIERASIRAAWAATCAPMLIEHRRAAVRLVHAKCAAQNVSLVAVTGVKEPLRHWPTAA